MPPVHITRRPWSGALGLIVCLPLALAMSTVTTTNQAVAVTSDRPVQLGGIAHDVAVDGDMAYLGVGHRVLVIDSSDPMSPVVVGETPSLPGRIGQVVFDAGRVYVGYGFEIAGTGDETGLALIDVSEPASPQILFTIATPSRPSGLDVTGGFAYVALGVDGLSIVDCRNTAAPVLRGRLEATLGDLIVPERSAAIDVAVEGNLAVLLEVENTRGTFHILRTVDVTDPDEPRQLGSYRPDRFPIGVALDGDNAYVAEAGGITVLSLSDRLNPEVIGRLEGLPSTGLDLRGNRLNGNTIVLEGGRAYFFGAPVDLARRVWIADVSSPGSPMILGDILTHDLSVGLSIHEEDVYVANWGGGGSRDYRGMEIYGSSNASMPTALGYINRETWHALNVVVDADLAFVAAAGNGLRVVDILSPVAPRLVGSLEVGGQIADVVVTGKLAYLADGGDGVSMHVVDVSDPAGPLLVTSLNAPAGRAVAVELLEDHLVLAFEDGRLTFWSLTDPRSPQLESSLDLGEHASDLQVSGDFVYVAARAGTGFPIYVRFQVVDASDIIAPRLVGSHDLTGSELYGAPSLAVDAERLYLPAAEVLQVLEIRAGTAPESMGSVPLFSPGSGVAIRDGYAYLVEHYSLAVIDVSEPSSPREVVYWPWSALVDATRATGIAFAGDCVFYAHSDAGLLSNCPDLPAVPVPTATGTEDPTAGPSIEPPPIVSPTGTLLPTSTTSPTVTSSPGTPDVPTAEPATPTVPSPTIESSSTPIPSQTQTPVRATPSPPFTSGPPSIIPIYLPLALLEHCPPKNLFTDVVLVLDASTSMRELTVDRRQKVDVAIEAAEVFIDGLRLSPGQDRVAVVTFNEEASTLHRLTDDPLLAKESLNRLRIEAHSRVDLGIARATVELIARGRPAHVRAMVVLSDGKVNQVGADAPGIAARQAQLADITVYVVGMGPSMDERVLREMASGDERYFAAPEPLLIRAIYADLTTRVPCPADAYWGRR